MNKPEETQGQVKASKITGRILLCLSYAIRCKCLGMREEYTEIFLERNGFTKGEAQECLKQVRDRWSKMSDKKKEAMMKKVGQKQYLKDTGLRRG